MLMIVANSVIDLIYSILLERLWFWDAKAAQYWGTNMITFYDNDTIRIINFGSFDKKTKKFALS